MNKIRLLLLLLVLALPSFLRASEREVPASFATLEELRAWVQEHKGFGSPSEIDFDLGSIRLYVAHNSPFSGRAGVYSYAYYKNSTEGDWRLVDSDFFEKKGALSYVYVDSNENDLVYVNFDGKVLKRFPLKDYSYK